MTVTVTKAGPYYASGEIKFSDLRRVFRAQQRKQTSSGSETFNTDTASISATELLRVTDTTETNPIVPDSTENSNISTSNNLKLSEVIQREKKQKKSAEEIAFRRFCNIFFTVQHCASLKQFKCLILF